VVRDQAVNIEPVQMTSRDRVFATLDHRWPDRLPRDIWGWRYIQACRADDWARVTGRFPLDFERVPTVLGPSRRARGERGDAGMRVDDWGSVWRSLAAGASGEVAEPAIKCLAEVETYRPPYEMLERPALEAVRQACGATSRFRLGEVGPGPFERIQSLRGSENGYFDLADQDQLFRKLLDTVHEFNLRHFELWSQTDVDGVTLGDDWGSQTALLVSPALWRRQFQPLYAEYFALLHRAGKRVFFHSDGMIREIIPDLIAIGADALNCQLSCMDIEELGRSFQDKVTFWGELDPQSLLPFGTAGQVREGADRVRRALASAGRNFIAQLSWGSEVPTENVLAAFEAWSRPLDIPGLAGK